MTNPKRIERRVVNGEQSVTLALEFVWEYGESNGAEFRTYVDGQAVFKDDFDRLMQMLALPGRGVP